MSESFESAMVTVHKYRLLSDKMCDRLQKAHEHDMEHHMREQYHRGYEDGKKSMDAEHYAVALRLRRLPLDEDSHGNLSQIARAVWHNDFGWTRGACDGLRDELIRLMGGVHDDFVPVGTSCGACGADCDCGAGESRRVTYYDELGNERREVVCRLREWSPDDIEKSELMYQEAEHMIYAALGVKKELFGFYKGLDVLRDRLIHLLGGDEPTLRDLWGIWKDGEPDSQKSPNLADSDGEDGGEVTITADLRDCVNTATKQYDDTLWYEMGDESEADHTICHITEGELLGIADSIDAQFKRLCEQQEAVLQQTIEGLFDNDELYAVAASFAGCDECGEYKQSMYREFEKRVAVEKERDELQAKLDAIRDALDE